MAEYRVREKSFVNNAIREPGDIVDLELDPPYDKKLHANLEPLKPPKPAKAAKAAEGEGGEGDGDGDGDTGLA